MAWPEAAVAKHEAATAWLEATVAKHEAAAAWLEAATAWPAAEAADMAASITERELRNDLAYAAAWEDLQMLPASS